ncbi:hypothetical protein NW762_011621 [Fusarium torreyae]|uniref:B3/B4 tRNA-binding domain-containing protein n=1 Tax=Fusarium torreyae TaxID=1237075 RepID=A0A9W8RP39_9HYPO|nr:hypothetical protein NW762_011621 [Fusarium torreyae]
MVFKGIPPGPRDAASEAMLKEAEEQAQRTRNSLEALTLRVDKGGLPRLNRLTDIYNAISVKHHIPIGGEDLDKYDGAPFLIRATGKEEFHTTASEEPSTELAALGEPIWCESTGITYYSCSVILDALKPLSDEELVESAEELGAALKALSPWVDMSYRDIINDPA